LWVGGKGKLKGTQNDDCVYFKMIFLSLSYSYHTHFYYNFCIFLWNWTRFFFWLSLKMKYRVRIKDGNRINEIGINRYHRWNWMENFIGTCFHLMFIDYCNQSCIVVRYKEEGEKESESERERDLFKIRKVSCVTAQR
jgi:hypothetical protein